MSKAEIIQELPKLKPEERREVLECIWALDENTIVNEGAALSSEEKDILDRELADFQANPSVGATWKAVEARLPDRAGQ